MSEYTHENQNDPERTEPTRTEQERGVVAEPVAGPDAVLVDGPAKLAHEDMPATQAQVDDENVETRDGYDLEAGKSARQLHDERAEHATSDDN
jgi:hypothetical protein